MPNNKKFFVLFDKVALHLSQMSQLFLDAVNSRNGTFGKYIEQLDELEQANDIITHKLFVELGKNFITPFDREDIHYLASGLDDIADAMLGTTKQMRSHSIMGIDNVAAEIAGYNLKIIEHLSDAVMGLRNLRNPEKVIVKCRKIKSIIAQASYALDTASQNLFKKDEDAVIVIRRMDHYERLQYLVKKCSDAVNVIESIVIKYG